ncbi:MAG: hypothetical protein L6W00_02530 [Lentisphaeria bacterium]|nr:MAG: hypothetical protein L6W00_02530 [Lentisphaeria bacterium]
MEFLCDDLLRTRNFAEVEALIPRLRKSSPVRRRSSPPAPPSPALC